MNIDVVELICEKLGTTVESLVPAVNEYLMHDANIGITVGAVLFGLGMLLLIIGFAVDRHADGLFFFLIGGCAFVIGGGMLGINIYFKHIYKAYPTISAYKEILGWISRQ